jgi:lauroyl/myristoyl acyltransferase
VSGWMYRLLAGLSAMLGLWVMRAFAWCVSTGYFLFKPGRVATSMDFFRSVFPERGWFYRLGLTWRQFHRFAALFAERIRMARGGHAERTEEGWELIERAASDGSGGVLLMSHLGNWESAAHLFRAEGVRLMLFMGERQREQVEKVQKADFQRSGVELVISSAEAGEAFTAVEGLRFIRSGGMVSFAGDRLWNEAQRSVEVQMFGRRVRLPAGPHLFALATGAPLFTFFAVRTRRHHYQLVAHGPRRVKAESRADRWPAIQRSAQAYAQMMEEVVRRFPTHWYHFEPFLGEAWEAGERGSKTKGAA